MTFPMGNHVRLVLGKVKLEMEDLDKQFVLNAVNAGLIGGYLQKTFCTKIQHCMVDIQSMVT